MHARGDWIKRERILKCARFLAGGSRVADLHPRRTLQGNAANRNAELAGEAAIALVQEGWRIAEAAG
jgi:hypothetical protein